MEAFEAFVAVALESEGYVVSEAVKFPVTLQTKKAAYAEIQTHGYEVDVVGARRDRLVLATVKSFFGSRGVAADHVDGTTTNAAARNGYRVLNDAAVRGAVLAGYSAHGCRWAGWVWPGVAQQVGQRRQGESSASSNACRDRAWSSVTSWWSRRALSNQSW
jgi:hypothetical protein